MKIWKGATFWKKLWRFYDI